MYWTGCVLSALPVLMLIMSGVMKLQKPDDVVKGFNELGWNPDRAPLLGIVELACTLLYVLPPTSVLGAILLTGYFGGAIATHARLDQPLLLGALGLGVLVWLGLFLREERLRRILPWRTKEESHDAG